MNAYMRVLQMFSENVFLMSQVKLEKDQQKMQPKSAKGKAASGPPSTAPQLDREGNAEQPFTSGRASSPIAGWTAEQRAALQRAFLTVQPSQRNFWQHVAKQVPGKTALECCNCKFDELPTPVEKVKQTSRLMPGRDSSPIQPPALKLDGGQLLTGLSALFLTSVICYCTCFPTTLSFVTGPAALSPLVCQ